MICFFTKDSFYLIIVLRYFVWATLWMGLRTGFLAKDKFEKTIGLVLVSEIDSLILDAYLASISIHSMEEFLVLIGIANNGQGV